MFFRLDFILYVLGIWVCNVDILFIVQCTSHYAQLIICLNLRLFLLNVKCLIKGVCTKLIVLQLKQLE